jgi:hypothetical protein
MSGAQYNLTPATINLTLSPITDGESDKPAGKSNAVIFIDELKKLDELHIEKKISDEEYAKMRTSLIEKYSK